MYCWDCMEQHIENVGHHGTHPGRAHATSLSKNASSDTPLERQPMRDISNKLHALVDEFVNNLSSECDSLANTISSQASVAARLVEAAMAPRSSNRTTTEVLNGLRRPSENPVVDKIHREEKSHVDPGKLNSTEVTTRDRDAGKFLRTMRDTQQSTASVEGSDTPSDVRSAEYGTRYTASQYETPRGRGKADMAAIGKVMQSIEILSSDQSSDDCLLTHMKYSKSKQVKQKSSTIKTSTPRGRPAGTPKQSPSMSRESSHLMNYSYEEDTHSLGGSSPGNETTFPKLIWPADEVDEHEVRLGTKSENNSAPSKREKHKKSGGQQAEWDLSDHQGDESNEEDVEGNPVGTESDGEEMPVLPKVPVKRKLLNEGKSSEKRTQKGRAKSASPQMKKQKTPQIDASVITKLHFGRRPPNCVSIEVG